jgi:hypothetical protein
MSAPRVHVHIGAIALRGFSADQRDQIVSGLRRELARQFTSTPEASRSVSSLSGGRIAVARGASASHIGRDAARRIGRSLRT